MDWVDLSSTSSFGNSSITVSVSLNSSSFPRSGTITFTAGDIIKEHDIDQQGNPKP